MAKAKYTKNGNVRVTMTEDQYVIFRAILDKIVLGRQPFATSVMTSLVRDLSECGFEFENQLDDCIEDICDRLSLSLETDERGNVSWAINVN